MCSLVFEKNSVARPYLSRWSSDLTLRNGVTIGAELHSYSAALPSGSKATDCARMRVDDFNAAGGIIFTEVCLAQAAAVQTLSTCTIWAGLVSCLMAAIITPQ